MVSNSKIALIVTLVVVATVVAITVPLVLNNNNEDKQATSQQQQNSLDQGTAGAGKSPVATTSPSSNSNSNNEPNFRRPSTAPASDSAPVVASPAPVSRPTTTPTLSPTATPTTIPDAPTLPPVPAGTVQSFTTASGIDYYHCVGAEPDDTTSASTHHIFLLHGASFDRDVWVDDTEILADFCDTPGVRVSALDLPVSANYQQLQTVIDQVAAQQQQSSSLITTKPVVLVTPSASGYSVVSWMLTSNANGEWSEIPNYIETWVPVAPVALSSASDDQIIGSFGTAVPVLAIYGDEDSGGKRLSERLGSVVGATVVELSGGHPVYLQSEQEFVQTILDFID